MEGKRVSPAAVHLLPELRVRILAQEPLDQLRPELFLAHMLVKNCHS